eukprot:8340885-Pyramimonas_sp.AAC.1
MSSNGGRVTVNYHSRRDQVHRGYVRACNICVGGMPMKLKHGFVLFRCCDLGGLRQSSCRFGAQWQGGLN